MNVCNLIFILRCHQFFIFGCCVFLFFFFFLSLFFLPLDSPHLGYDGTHSLRQVRDGATVASTQVAFTMPNSKPTRERRVRSRRSRRKVKCLTCVIMRGLSMAKLYIRKDIR
jgi:hypothetical protein